MKQNHFSFAIKFSLIALAFIFAVTSCTKKTSDIGKPVLPEEFPTAKSGSVQEVPLRVTVRDAAGDKITSDGGGDYINGSQYVQATFSQSGNFQFNCGMGGHGNSTYMVRWLNFNNDSPSQVFIDPPVTAILKGTFISTGQSSLQGTYVPLQSLAINQSECICLTTGMGGIYSVNFHRGPVLDITNSPTAYMVVTRINSTTWTMTPVGSCSLVSNIAALIEASTGTIYGYYNMPFSFTLTKL
jgi:hypothetical protein